MAKFPVFSVKKFVNLFSPKITEKAVLSFAEPDSTYRKSHGLYKEGDFSIQNVKIKLFVKISSRKFCT